MFNHCLLLDFISREQKLAAEWQAALDKPLVIVACDQKEKNTSLLFDVRL